MGDKRKGWTYRACPLCGSRDESGVFAQEDFDPGKLDKFAYSSRKIPENMHYRLLVCPDCDVLYSSPTPPKGDLAQAYHEAAFDSAEEARYAARTYGRLLPAIKEKLAKAEGALDIGTGDGAFLRELLDAGFTKVEGVEPSLAPIRTADPRVRGLIRHKLFKPAQYRKKSLSLVTCFQTFEHLSEPLPMSRGAFGLLRSGGAFFAVFHNRRSLSAALLGLKSPIYDIEHLQLFSPASAKFMLERSGFRDVRVRTLYNTYPLHYWVKLLPFPRGMKKVLMGVLKGIGLGYLPVPLPAGNMAVIGWKP